jgi:hypothetical protein
MERKINNTIECISNIEYDLNIKSDFIKEKLIESCIDENGQLYYDENDTNQIFALSYKDCAKVVSKLIGLGVIAFPFKKYFMESPNDKFEKLKNYVPRIVNEHYKLTDVKQLVTPNVLLGVTSSSENFLSIKNQSGQSLIIKSSKEDYNINVLSDLFQEEQRISSLVGKHETSVLDEWSEVNIRSPEFIYEALKKYKGVLNPYILREEFYNLTRALEPTSFRPTVVKALFSILGARRILDMSSGWGDRLLGAISVEQHIQYYVGVDPNYKLQPGYSQMINTLAKDKSKFIMIESPFETAVLPQRANKFDCIFTSPPYYDYEKYGDGKDSSITNYPEFESWIVDFLFTSILKAWSHLDEGGYFALNISDPNELIRNGTFFTEPTILFMHAFLPGSFYNGVIGFANDNNRIVRPIWIFRKTHSTRSNESSERVAFIKRVKAAMKDKYPKIFSYMNSHF